MRCRTLSLLFGVSLMIAIGGSAVSAQSISIFGNAVPTNPIDDPGAMTLGVKFWSSQAGMISAIRFYRAVVSSQGYVANLYSANRTLLGSVTLEHESGAVPGWQVAYFPSPIPISANTTYIATYYCPAGQGAWDQHELDNAVTNGPLTAPAGGMVGGNGVYISGNAFPTMDYAHDNYYVDVLFTPTGRSLFLNFSPPKPSILANAPLGSEVATITPTWSDGSPFTGTLSFAPPYSNNQGVFAISGNNLIVSPSGPGVFSDANTTVNVTIVATQ